MTLSAWTMEAAISRFRRETAEWARSVSAGLESLVDTGAQEEKFLRMGILGCLLF